MKKILFSKSIYFIKMYLYDSKIKTDTSGSGSRLRSQNFMKLELKQEFPNIGSRLGINDTIKRKIVGSANFFDALIITDIMDIPKKNLQGSVVDSVFAYFAGS